MDPRTSSRIRFLDGSNIGRILLSVNVWLLQTYLISAVWYSKSDMRSRPVTGGYKHLASRPAGCLEEQSDGMGQS